MKPELPNGMFYTPPHVTEALDPAAGSSEYILHVATGSGKSRDMYRMLQRCAARMIISGNWHKDRHTDRNIKAAFDGDYKQDELIEAAKRFRDNGELFDEVRLQLDGLTGQNTTEPKG